MYEVALNSMLLPDFSSPFYGFGDEVARFIAQQQKNP